LEVYNVEAAFLNPNPESKMYIQIPGEIVELGFATQEEQELFAILLDQNMYGSIDAALHFFKKYSGVLVDELSFTQSLTNPCMFFKHEESRHLAIVLSTHDIP